MANALTRLFRRGEQRSIPESWFNIDPDVPYGRQIDLDRATRLSYVFAALRHIVDYVSTLPIDSYRTNQDQTRSKIATPALFRNQDAPGRAGLEQWMGQAVFGMAAHGNAVGFITDTDGFGFPTVVNWIRKPEWTFDEANKQWFIGGQPVPSSLIVHIPWIVPPGCTLGLSPIEHYAAVVRAGLSAQEYADVRRGGGVPPAHLKNTQRTLDKPQAAATQSQAAASFASGKPFVSGNDWDLTLLSIPPNHVQFIETLKLGANQIAAIYGINPDEIGGQAANSLTYSTEELRELRRASDMRPYIIRLERAFSRILPQQQSVTLNVDATLRTDAKTRAEIQDTKIRNGTLLRNEARASDDMPPIPGGDEPVIPTSTGQKGQPAQQTGETP